MVPRGWVQTIRQGRSGTARCRRQWPIRSRQGDFEGLSMAYTYILFLGLKNAKVNGANASIAASCFDRVEELAEQGFDESVI